MLSEVVLVDGNMPGDSSGALEFSSGGDCNMLVELDFDGTGGGTAEGSRECTRVEYSWSAKSLRGSAVHSERIIYVASGFCPTDVVQQHSCYIL